MKNYIFSLFLAAICIAQPLAGQISGYQGKRWVLTAGPGLNTVQLFIKDHRLDAFSQASVQASYVTSRHGSTGVGLTYIGTPNYVTGYEYGKPGQGAAYFTEPSNLPYNRWKDPAKLQFLVATAEQRFILNGRKGALAPCGVYVMLGAGGYMSWYTGVADSLQQYIQKRLISTVGKIGVGSQKVYRDRIVVDFGLESSLPLTVFGLKSRNLEGYPAIAYSQYENSGNQIAGLWFMAFACPYIRVGLLR